MYWLGIPPGCCSMLDVVSSVRRSFSLEAGPLSIGIVAG